MSKRILGQRRALESLDQALRSGRVHHSWIFSGLRGVGKFSTAIEMARVLLDPASPRNMQFQLAEKSPTALAATDVQRMIDAGTHPDLHIIRKELAKYSDNRDLREKKQSNIPIDLLRERIIGGYSGDTNHEAPAYRTPQLGHGKVFIIDEAELLDQYGQNAMLKTLEEPPSETYFFLITNQPDRLLPTIRSRSQHVRFGSLDDAAMRDWVASIRATAELTIDPKTLPWVLQFADGSPGVAMVALEYGFADWQHALHPMLVDLERGKFPAALGDLMGKLIEEFAQAWVAKHGKKNTSKDAANKDGARHMFTLLAWHARQRLAEVAASGDDPEPPVAIIDHIRLAERQLESNVNIKLLMENLAVQWWRTGSLAATS